PEGRDRERFLKLLDDLRALNRQVANAATPDSIDMRRIQAAENAIIRALEALVDLAGPEPLDGGGGQSPVGTPAAPPQQDLSRRQKAAYLRGLWEQHGILQRVATLYNLGGPARLRQSQGILRQFTHETGVVVKWVSLAYIAQRQGEGDASIFA